MGRVVLVRVDDRFVHGQVLEGWVPYTRANAILIISDELSRDEYRKRAMTLSAPQGVEVLVKDTVHGLEYLKGLNETKESYRLMRRLRLHRERRVLVIFGDLKDALSAYHRGFHFESLNIGNLHHPDYTKALSKSVFLNEEDLRILAELEEEGVAIDVRAVPVHKKGLRGVRR